MFYKVVCLRKYGRQLCPDPLKVFLRCHVSEASGCSDLWPPTSNQIILSPSWFSHLTWKKNQSFLRWNLYCQTDLCPLNCLLLTQSGRGLHGSPAEFRWSEFISQLSFFQIVFQWRDETKWKSGNIFISKYRHDEVQVASRCYTGEFIITSFHSYLWPLSKTHTCKSTRVLLQLWPFACFIVLRQLMFDRQSKVWQRPWYHTCCC